LDQTFFTLTLDYRKLLEEETYYMVKHIGFTDSDVQNMPTYRRKFQINMYLKEIEKQKEHYEKEQRKNKR
jgi:hypothetical protein